MIELLPLTEVKLAEVFLGIIFVIISIIIAKSLIKLRKLPYLTSGFLFIILWSLIEAFDEFVANGVARELIFNIFGRIILILGLVTLIIGYKKLLKTEPNKKEKQKND